MSTSVEQHTGDGADAADEERVSVFNSNDCDCYSHSDLEGLSLRILSPL